MTIKDKTAVIILSRGGSAGLKNKALCKVGDKTLLEICINDAKKAGLNNIYFSTDSKEYAKEAEKHGAKIVFRPEYLCSSVAPVEESLRFSLYEIEKNKKYDYVCYMQVTDLFRDNDLIEKCIETMRLTKSLDSVFAITKTHKNYWKFENNNFIPIAGHSNNYYPRQLKTPLYREDTGLCLISKSEIIRGGHRIGNPEKCAGITNENETFDIHTQADLDLVNFYYERKLID